MYGKRKRIGASAMAAYGVVKRAFGAKRTTSALKHRSKRPKLRMRTGGKLKHKRGGSRTNTATTINTEATANAHSGINTQT